MYEVIVILKALTEVAGVAFFGQGVLWVIAGAKRDQNVVYKLFKTLTSPVTRVTRIVTPRIILDAHIGLVAFFLLMQPRLEVVTLRQGRDSLALKPRQALTQRR